MVFYSELDDLDLDVLRSKGYTYDTYFPEVDDIAAFIYHAYDSGMNIICQCEYGQSRSAGCAAAILEHFYGSGISVFSNYNYYPNQVVYHKIYDALEKQKRYHDNKYYFAANAESIKSHIEKLKLPETLISGYQPENGNSAVDVKYEIERCLSERCELYHTSEEIITALLKNGQPLYASFTVTKPYYMYDRYLWNAYAVYTYFRYGCEEIPVNIWFRKYRSNTARRMLKSRKPKREYSFPFSQLRSLDFLGRLSWDSERKMIDAVPLIITNIQL